MARAEEVIDLLVREGGKTRLEALGMEVVLVADLVRYFAKHAPEMLAPVPVPLHLMKHRASYLHYVPRGVVGVIAPWNFPFVDPDRRDDDGADRRQRGRAQAERGHAADRAQGARSSTTRRACRRAVPGRHRARRRPARR